jgi:hypothetical protein
MKKLLTVIISLVLVFSLGACKSASNDTDLEKRVETLEAQVEELEAILVDLEIIEGLNGQREYYLPETNNEYSVFNSQTLSASDIELTGEEIDTLNAPSYLLDADGKYIEFETVMDLLIAKYYGGDVNATKALLGGQIQIELDVKNIEMEEYMAKLIMLVEELAHYDFYIIGSSEISILLDRDSLTSGYMIIPIPTMRSTFITFTPEVFYTGSYEIQLYRMTFNKDEVQTLYDGYELEGTYDGFVLDYTE